MQVLNPTAFDQQETLGFLAAQLSRVLSLKLRDALQPLGLMPAQFTALAEIWRDDGLTQKELVERLDVEQPGVARTLSGLAEGGWIVRQDIAKGRSQGLYLTEKARATLPAAAAAAAEVNRLALADLSRTERAHLIDRIGELAAALKSR